MPDKNTVTRDPEHMANQSVEGNGYRRAFLGTLLACVALALVAGVLWWRLRSRPTMNTAPTPITSDPKASDMPAMPAARASEAPPTETPVAPIQLSPQRMQSIGVTIGTVESKPVNDEIRFYGNVQANERRLAYVRTRFVGRIRPV